VTFNSLKQLLDGLHAQKMYLVKLVPDLQLDSFEQPLGYRKQALANLKEYPFLVCEDLFCLATQDESQEMPMLTKSSKVWPRTRVPDYDKMGKDGLLCTALPSQLAQVIAQADEKLCPLDQFILAACFRHVCQIPDNAARNFLWVPRARKVFSVDEDATLLARSADCPTGDKLVSKTKELEVIQRHLKKKANETRLIDVLKAWQTKLGSDEGKKILSQLPSSGNKVLTNLESLINALPATFRK